MAAKPANEEQKHPQAAGDRAIVATLLTEQPTDYNRAELARLLIRYRGFPGARDIQADLKKVLNQWQLTENELYDITRKIHDKANIYKGRAKKGEEEDWS